VLSLKAVGKHRRAILADCWPRNSTWYLVLRPVMAVRPDTAMLRNVALSQGKRLTLAPLHTSVITECSCAACCTRQANSARPDWMLEWACARAYVSHADIRARAELSLVGTPLTHARYLRRHRGSYGPAIRAGDAMFPGPVTPIPGLYCAGDSTFPGAPKMPGDVCSLFCTGKERGGQLVHSTTSSLLNSTAPWYMCVQ
jgi:hypothetical protein